MTHSMNRTRRPALTLAIAAAALAPIGVVHADAQYKADRAYCLSGEASEARDLCLKEAAAAQADREKGADRSAVHHKHRSEKQSAASPAAKGASNP